MQGFFVGVIPFLMHAAVRAQHIAVIRGVNDDCVLKEPAVAQPLINLEDFLIDHVLQVVIHLVVLGNGRVAEEHFAIFFGIILLRAGLGGQVFAAVGGSGRFRFLMKSGKS